MFGCQVTIQSEQEKQMMKMYRRGEKRERKRGKGAEDSDASDASVTFDPREMRAQRYFIAPDFFLPLFFIFLFCSQLVRLPLCVWVQPKFPRPNQQTILNKTRTLQTYGKKKNKKH